jgi:putative PIN family toxin of toxin-antitoxin system
MHEIVLDTNVFISALRSRLGASFALLSAMGKSWIPLISVPTILEYEAVGSREAEHLNVPQKSIDAFVRAFCFYGREVDVHFRLRPTLRDPRDEFILELAVAGQAEAIVTHNVRHFYGSQRFGIRAIRPGEFLRIIERERK